MERCTTCARLQRMLVDLLLHVPGRLRDGRMVLLIASNGLRSALE